MTLEAWRVVATSRARNAFDGEGARLYGGRWNSPGTRIIYTSATASLALLEILVHVDSTALLKRYTLIRVEFDETLVERSTRTALPRKWAADPPPAETRSLGDRWVAEKRSAVLAVPSAITPQEMNYLLNPAHPDFGRISHQQAETLRARSAIVPPLTMRDPYGLAPAFANSDATTKT